MTFHPTLQRNYSIHFSLTTEINQHNTTALVVAWAKHLDTSKLFIINNALSLVLYSKLHTSKCITILIYTEISNTF
jgi:hypothetical protein